MRQAESCHWYDKQGNPCYTVLAKNGNERNTTLADARKMDLVPSVTTIMACAAKPHLEQWKLNQMMMSFLTLPKIDGESLESLEERLWADANQQSSDARDKGIDIHGQIEAGFLSGGSENPYYLAVMNVLDEIYPDEKWITEKSFCSDSNYGGKVDLYSNGGYIVIDFKTKDFKDDDKVDKFIYPSHGMQLSAYYYGLFGLSVEYMNEWGIHPKRINIFIRPMKDGELVPAVKVFNHSNELNNYARDFDMFNALFTYWKLSKNFNQGEQQ